MNVRLIYTHFTEPINESLYSQYLALLPQDLKIRNGKFLKWQDRHNHLFGKIFLIYLASELGLDHKLLEELKYTDYGRPFFNSSIDFNIFHSGSTVACAIAQGAKLGLDIERYSEVNFSDFRKIHSQEQWKIISSSENPLQSFFDYWTIKESVVKANGKGLSIALDQIKIDNNSNRAIQGTQEWCFERLRLGEKMAGCLACDHENFEISIEEISQEQIYERKIG